MTIPSCLFRYYPANSRTLSSIREKSFYIGGVESFNDPFECQIIRGTNGNETALQNILDHYQNSDRVPQWVRKALRNVRPSVRVEMINRCANDMIEQAKRDFINARGVICFSETNDNLLMWSHYASGGTGVCIEYRTEHDFFKNAVKVSYSDRPPVVDALAIMESVITQHEPSWIKDLYCTKPIEWQYEREWRVIHQKRNTIYTFPGSCLKSIFFGPRCPKEFIDETRLAASDTHFIKTYISDETYKIQFKPFTEVD